MVCIHCDAQNPKKQPLALLLLVVVLVCGGLFAGCHFGLFGTVDNADQSANATLTWQEQYDLGMRYVAEGNYQEAIIAFTAAISIDPKQPDPYIILADVYLAQDDLLSAINILAKGYAATQDATIAAKLEVLGEGTEETTIATILTNGIESESALLTADEVTFYGQSAWGIDIFTVRTLLENNGWVVTDNSEFAEDDDTYWWIQGTDARDSVTLYPAHITAFQNYDNETVQFLDYYWVDGDPTIAEHTSVGIRDIALGDSLLSVYTALGFTNGDTLIAYLQEVCQSLKDGEPLDDSLNSNRVYQTTDGTIIIIYCSASWSSDLEEGEFENFRISFDFKTTDGYQNITLEFEDGGFQEPFDPATAVLKKYEVYQS